MARILDKSEMDISVVRLLTKVTIKNIDTDITMSYTIVSESEADLTLKKISGTSPIGKGLIGSKVGDIVKIQVPNGTIKFQILEISNL